MSSMDDPGAGRDGMVGSAPRQAPAVERSAARSEAPRATVEERLLMPALTKGWQGCCPSCGEAALFQRFLEVRHTCPSCGEELHHHRADDLPAWLTMIVTGHALVPLLLLLENMARPPLWLHGMIWIPFVVGLSLWLLPRIKGAVVGMQWAWLMHGFGSEPD